MPTLKLFEAEADMPRDDDGAAFASGFNPAFSEASGGLATKPRAVNKQQNRGTAESRHVIVSPSQDKTPLRATAMVLRKRTPSPNKARTSPSRVVRDTRKSPSRVPPHVAVATATNKRTLPSRVHDTRKSPPLHVAFTATTPPRVAADPTSPLSDDDDDDSSSGYSTASSSYVGASDSIKRKNFNESKERQNAGSPGLKPLRKNVPKSHTKKKTPPPELSEEELNKIRMILDKNDRDVKSLTLAVMTCSGISTTVYQRMCSPFFIACKLIEMHPRQFLMGTAVERITVETDMLRSTGYKIPRISKMSFHLQKSLTEAHERLKSQWKDLTAEMSSYYTFASVTGLSSPDDKEPDERTTLLDQMAKIDDSGLVSFPDAPTMDFMIACFNFSRLFLHKLWLSWPEAETRDVFPEILEWVVLNLKTQTSETQFKKDYMAKVESNLQLMRAKYGDPEPSATVSKLNRKRKQPEPVIDAAQPEPGNAVIDAAQPEPGNAVQSEPGSEAVTAADSQMQSEECSLCSYALGEGPHIFFLCCRSKLHVRCYCEMNIKKETDRENQNAFGQKLLCFMCRNEQNSVEVNFTDDTIDTDTTPVLVQFPIYSPGQSRLALSKKRLIILNKLRDIYGRAPSAYDENNGRVVQVNETESDGGEVAETEVAETDEGEVAETDEREVINVFYETDEEEEEEEEVANEVGNGDANGEDNGDANGDANKNANNNDNDNDNDNKNNNDHDIVDREDENVPELTIQNNQAQEEESDDEDDRENEDVPELTIQNNQAQEEESDDDEDKEIQIQDEEFEIQFARRTMSNAKKVATVRDIKNSLDTERVYGLTMAKSKESHRASKTKLKQASLTNVKELVEEIRAKDQILGQILDCYLETVNDESKFLTAVKGCLHGSPQSVWKAHHAVPGSWIHLDPPAYEKIGTVVSFTVPGESFVQSAMDCFLVMKIFLTSCDNRRVAPDRWEWEHHLTKLMEEIGDFDENTKRFAQLVCLVLSGNTKDYGCITDTAKLAKAGKLTVNDLASANKTEIKKLIRPCGYHRKRAVYLIEMAKKIRDEHGGVVPDKLEALMDFLGVGRKTAILTLNETFGKFEGIGVDIHVTQCCLAFDFLKLPQSLRCSPLHTEMALREFVPERKFPEINKIFGSVAQLFTQTLPLRAGQGDNQIVSRICSAVCDFLHKDYHIELFFCMLKLLREQYVLRPIQDATQKKKYTGVPDGDSL
jgi:endonuclease III